MDSVLHIDAGGLCQRYKLRGVVYFSGEHFTSRVITGNGMVWFHDGLFTDRLLVYESQYTTSIPVENATLAVYIREN